MIFVAKLFEDPQFYLMWVLLVVFSVCCHEYAHAQMALWQGDGTAAEEGHLTLNPLRQMGTLSLVALLVFGLAWGQVPVNPARTRRRWSEAAIAFAGPAMNVALFVAFSLLATAAIAYEMPDNAVGLFWLGAVLNVVLFLFNMLPAPPLDGWAIALYLFPGLSRLNAEFRNGMIVGVTLLVLTQFGKLYELGGTITAYAVTFFGMAFRLGEKMFGA